MGCVQTSSGIPMIGCCNEVPPVNQSFSTSLRAIRYGFIGLTPVRLYRQRLDTIVTTTTRTETWIVNELTGVSGSTVDGVYTPVTYSYTTDDYTDTSRILRYFNSSQELVRTDSFVVSDEIVLPVEGAFLAMLAGLPLNQLSVGYDYDTGLTGAPQAVTFSASNYLKLLPSTANGFGTFPAILFKERYARKSISSIPAVACLIEITNGVHVCTPNIGNPTINESPGILLFPGASGADELLRPQDWQQGYTAQFYKQGQGPECCQ